MKQRKRLRLLNYNYSQSGYYFITVCIKSGTLLGRIVKSKVQLNAAGKIVKECWHNLPKHYNNCILDYYVIMPDHFHGIIIIDNDVWGGIPVEESLRPSSTTKTTAQHHRLPEIVRAFKSFSSRKINEQNLFKERFHWQRSFYDRIIRNKKELVNIRSYIEDNPYKLELESNPIAHIF